ncbi:MAG TPA: hypothetical protein PLT23_11595 [Lentisphaeria bacterium]|nr:MAG: hypothetical protein BWX73_01672 [Lentisphaerae bacterium ADurb.Bin082]HPY91364.1 hypothetical protein [Lentisphaeria bacterium]
MILLASGNLLVASPGGPLHSLDLERLTADLREAFQAQGLASDWIADHLVLTLEEKLRTRGHGEPVSEAVMHESLAAMLSAVGYGEVAAEYGRRHQVDPLAGRRRELHDWSAAGIRALLDRTLPLTPGQSLRLTEQCVAVLRQLGFQEVSDTFVCELAVHLLHRGDGGFSDPFTGAPQRQDAAAPMPGTTPAQNAAEQSQTPLFLPTKIKADQVDSFTRTLLETNVLRILPVSRLFPRLGVSVSLVALGETLTGGWQSPLTIMTALGRVAPSILALLAQMRQEYAAVLAGFLEAPCHLVFPGFAMYLAQGLGPMSRRERALLAREISCLLEDSLVAQADFPVMLSFR